MSVFRCDPDESAGMAEQAAFETLQTFTLRLIGPCGSWESDIPEAWQAWLRETEENLTDLLPAGYHIRILEWDAKEEE